MRYSYEKATVNSLGRLILGGAELQGITRVRKTVLARLMESQIQHPSAGSVALWWRVQKRNNGLYPSFCLEESCPPALILMPGTSVPLQMPLVPYKLLPHCWSSEAVSLSKFTCGYVERNCLGIQFLPLTQSSLIFAAKLRRLIFLALDPWPGG